MLIRDCFLDGRVFNDYSDGFQGQKVVIPFFNGYSSREKLMFFKYGNRELKVYFKDKDYFFKMRSEEHTSELQSRFDLVCRLLLEKKNHMISSTYCCVV